MRQGQTGSRIGFSENFSTLTGAGSSLNVILLIIRDRHSGIIKDRHRYLLYSRSPVTRWHALPMSISLAETFEAIKNPDV